MRTYRGRSKPRWRRSRPVTPGAASVETFRGWPVRLTLYGPPATKKTSNRIVRRKDGTVSVLPSLDWADWVKQLKAAIRWMAAPLDVVNPLDPKKKWKRRALAVEAQFYLAANQRPDVSGLYEGLGDALEEIGVVDNDYWIAAWPERNPRRRDPQRPRVEVTITPHEEDQ